MHILYCKVAQQTKFVISEAGRFLFFLQGDSLHGGVGLLQKAFPQEPQIPLEGRGEAGAALGAQRLQPRGGCLRAGGNSRGLVRSRPRVQ